MAGRAAGVGEQLRGELGALRLGELDDLDGEVVAAEAVDEARGIVEAELATMSSLHDGRCGGGEGDDRRRAEGGEMLAEHAVVGAEIVTPLRDAVGFVDGDERGLALGEHLREAGDAQALGGDEEEVEFAVEVVAAGRRASRGRGRSGCGRRARPSAESLAAWSSMRAMRG